MIYLGMVAWALFQTLSLPLEVIGWLALLLPAAFDRVHLRRSRSQLFPGLVTAWQPVWVGITAPLSGALLLIHWGPTAATAGIFLGALGSILQAWDNEENGVVPPRLVNGAPYMLGHPDSLRSYVWSAWRNPTAGLKVLLEGTISPAVKIVIRPNGYWATDGYRWCYARKFAKPILGLRGYRVGWLINTDARAGWRTWPVAENYG
jgi:hypothetical protein